MKLLTVIGACTLIAVIPFTSHAELNSDGNWKVKRGDTLYNIARRVAPGNGKEQARIRKHIFNQNPSAFRNNDPGSLEVGQTLSLPGSAVVVTKPRSVPQPKPVIKKVAPTVIAPVIAKPTPKASVPVTKVAPKGDNFKARIEAKRLAKEAADRERAEAQRLAAEQAKAAQMQANEKAAQQRESALAAKKKAEAMAAQKRADAARQAKQREAAALAAAKRKADAMAAQKRAAVQTTTPSPVNNTINTSNPYIECKTTDPSEKCGIWKITFKGR